MTDCTAQYQMEWVRDHHESTKAHDVQNGLGVPLIRSTYQPCKKRERVLYHTCQQAGSLDQHLKGKLVGEGVVNLTPEDVGLLGGQEERLLALQRGGSKTTGGTEEQEEESQMGASGTKAGLSLDMQMAHPNGATTITKSPKRPRFSQFDLCCLFLAWLETCQQGYSLNLERCRIF